MTVFGDIMHVWNGWQSRHETNEYSSPFSGTWCEPIEFPAFTNSPATRTVFVLRLNNETSVSLQPGAVWVEGPEPEDAGRGLVSCKPHCAITAPRCCPSSCRHPWAQPCSWLVLHLSPSKGQPAAHRAWRHQTWPILGGIWKPGRVSDTPLRNYGLLSELNSRG